MWCIGAVLALQGTQASLGMRFHARCSYVTYYRDLNWKRKLCGIHDYILVVFESLEYKTGIIKSKSVVTGSWALLVVLFS